MLLTEKFPEIISDRAKAEWYKMAGNEIGIMTDEDSRSFVELSKKSNVVKGLMACEQMRLYVPQSKVQEAKRILKEDKA
ncbi:MAG: hypothetical protein WC340_10510 [Kiritimatiellia bacterium]|jgi:hypothetical protein